MPATTKLPDITVSPASLAIGSASPVSSDSSTSRLASSSDLAVDDDLVAGPELDDVVEHHLAGRQRLGPGLPAHRRLGLPDDGQLVQGLLGPQLLDDADRAVGDDQQPEQRR